MEQGQQDKAIGQEESAEHVRIAVVEIILTMAMLESVFVGIEHKKVFFLNNEATGLVRLSGSHDGMLGVSTNQALLRVIVSSIVGVSPEELSQEDLLDGVAEIANMISGSFKARARLGGMSLSPPVAILGKEYVAAWKTSQPTQVLTFRMGEGEGEGSLQVSLSL